MEKLFNYGTTINDYILYSLYGLVFRAKDTDSICDAYYIWYIQHKLQH